MKKLLWIPVLLCLGLTSGAATASLVLQEDFSYDPGTLLTATGNWAAHSGAGTNAIPVTAAGLTYPGYPGSGIGNAASMLTNGEDDHTTAAFTLNSGSVYMAFLVNVSAAQSGDYFAHFYQTSSLFYGRIFMKNVSGSLNFGVTRGAGTANYSSTPFTYNTTHLVVVKYTFVPGTLNDTADLFVDPAIGPTEPAPLVSATDTGSTDGTSFVAASLRQGSSSAAPTQWVDGIRVASSWSEAVAGYAVGACCNPDGSCTVTTEQECPYVWHGEWVSCNPNPCPQPEGACCAPDGGCTLTTESACAPPSVWHGEGTSCDPNPCPQPQGACCLANGTCEYLTQSECTGTWLGMGTDCDPNPCEVALGACCAPDGSCLVESEAECLPPGVWHPEWTSCLPNPCPQPPGACCAPDGTCTYVLQSECAGNWLGYGTSCDPNPCPPPSGACCADNGSCTFVPQAECAGTWLGYGTDCDPNPCQQPGACCFHDGSCQVLTHALCEQQGGNYIGDGTSCNPYPCPPVSFTICEIAADNADGTPVLNDRFIETEGVAISASGTWSPTIQEFAITDGDCCVDVFGGALVPFVNIGDRVRVTGTIEVFNGKTEISSPGLTVTIISSGNPIPTPAIITTYDLSVNGEQYESCLFGVHCVRIVGGDPWPANGVNANITIDDGSGPVTMRIDKDTDIDGTPAPQGEFSLIGIGDQFDNSLPYTEFYQIKPRSLADIFYDCALPTGACCLTEGVCEVVPADTCSAHGGHFMGVDVPCDPNPCLLHVGACCYEHAVCQVQPDYFCTDHGGYYVGDNTTCSPNPCPSAPGACCFPDGICEMLPVTPCEASGGIWLGENVPCDPNPCPLPRGACCAPDGSCTITTQSDCQPPNTWMGPQTVCDPNPCPQVGACCFATGECQLLTQADCEQHGGIYQGTGTDCDPNPCPPPVPVKTTTWGQIKHEYSKP